MKRGLSFKIKLFLITFKLMKELRIVKIWKIKEDYISNLKFKIKQQTKTTVVKLLQKSLKRIKLIFSKKNKINYMILSEISFLSNSQHKLNMSLLSWFYHRLIQYDILFIQYHPMMINWHQHKLQNAFWTVHYSKLSLTHYHTSIHFLEKNFYFHDFRLPAYASF